jgi:hypothetical protein
VDLSGFAELQIGSVLLPPKTQRRQVAWQAGKEKW